MEASALPRVAPGVSRISSPRLLRVASDAHLVDLIRQGRGVAFEALYDRHHRAILSFCRHMLGSADEAEDAVQHTFLAAYNDLIATDRPMHLRAWLFTIARNRCYSMLRARREQPVAELDEPATEGLAAQVERRQDLRDLVLDLGRLPDEQRAALVLSEMDSLSHEQIGSVLGVPKDKVKALVFQARESLIASRAARETDCADIRAQLANLRGGALRRANLRRHLRECPGCREFREEVDRQRHQLRLLLPVAPTIALKEGVLGGGGVGAGATAVGGGTIAGSVFKGGVIKGLIGAALAGVGTAGTIVAVHDIQLSTGRAAHSHQAAASTRAPTRAAPVAAPAAAHADSRPAAVVATAAPGVAVSRSLSSSSSAAASRQQSRTSTATLVEVLHPLSPTGLIGTKPIISPLVPVAPVGVTPAQPTTTQPGQPTTNGNAPYLGTGTFGTGSQPAPPATKPSTSTPSTPAGSTPTSKPSAPTTTGSGTPTTSHSTTTSGGGHFANPVGGGISTRGGGPATSHGTTGPSTSSGSTGTGRSTSTTGSTPTQTTTTSSPPPTTTTKSPTPAPTEPTGGGRSGGSGSGTGTSGTSGTGTGTGTSTSGTGTSGTGTSGTGTSGTGGGTNTGPGGR